ncbi:MAG: hypothetical protein JWO31_1637 [Phycisphaerales bacterium]|nr:hypothetical protein [Phycisphaerales bacterium]
MGYDLTAHVPKAPPYDPCQVFPSDELWEKFAYLEMGARSSDARILFEVLDAVEYDKIVSGSGIGRCFAAAPVATAFRALCQFYLEGRASIRSVRFLAQVAEVAEFEPWIYIDFG